LLRLPLVNRLENLLQTLHCICSSTCENKMDINVEPHKKGDVKTKKIVSEDGLWTSLQTSKQSWIMKTCVTSRYCLDLLTSYHCWNLCMCSLSLHKWYVFVCDMWQLLSISSDIYRTYCDHISNFTTNKFWAFNHCWS
jgi:hypothetical protein